MLTLCSPASTAAAGCRPSGSARPAVKLVYRPFQRQICHHGVKVANAHVLRAATPSSPQQQQQPEEGDFEGLLPEEDIEVPGTYFDALNSQTKLGKAVKAAVEELEHLGSLESEVLQQCDGLLQQLGMKGSLFGSGAEDSSNPLVRLQQELQQQQQQQQQDKEQKADS